MALSHVVASREFVPGLRVGAWVAFLGALAAVPEAVAMSIRSLLSAWSRGRVQAPRGSNEGPSRLHSYP